VMPCYHWCALPIGFTQLISLPSSLQPAEFQDKSSSGPSIHSYVILKIPACQVLSLHHLFCGRRWVSSHRRLPFLAQRWMGV
jgi:hypothetical protein